VLLLWRVPVLVGEERKPPAEVDEEGTLTVGVLLVLRL
jgi:hypothetical protein